MQKGFTLVELAIVIVIIGLLVGGVLQGQELIKQAKINSSISEINQYRTAINTFKAKYNFWPGDIPEPHATSYGFQTRGTFAGQGDGNNVIQGVWGNGAGNNGMYQQQGETCMSWVDMSFVKLIKGTFDACRTNANAVAFADNEANVSRYVPQSAMGNGNRYFLWASAAAQTAGHWLTMQKGTATSGVTTPAPGLTVGDAYNFDKKIDDGLPNTGSVNTIYFPANNCCNPWWAGTTYGNYSTTATPVSATTCMDNNNVAGPLQYSTTTNSDVVNCALSFKMF